MLMWMQSLRHRRLTLDQDHNSKLALSQDYFYWICAPQPYTLILHVHFMTCITVQNLFCNVEACFPPWPELQKVIRLTMFDEAHESELDPFRSLGLHQLWMLCRCVYVLEMVAYACMTYAMRSRCRQGGSRDILASLPEDLAFQICNHLTLCEKFNCALVCKAWGRLALTDMQTIIFEPTADEQLEDFGSWLAESMAGRQASVKQLVLDCSLTGYDWANPMLDSFSQSPALTIRLPLFEKCHQTNQTEQQ